MRPSLSLVASFLPALAQAAAVAAPPSGKVAPVKRGDGYFYQQITALPRNETIPEFASVGIEKRQVPVVLTQQLSGTLYTVNIGIGTPEQPITVLLDTGSSELVVNPTCATGGGATAVAFCLTTGVYAELLSLTHTDLLTAATIDYGSGQATVDYVTDHVDIGATLVAQQFGQNVLSVNVYIGILGLGLRPNAATTQYTYVLDNFVQQGFISSRVFSLDLQTIGNPTGSVIFGGIDLAKFSGALEKLPILDLTAATGSDRYYIGCNAIGVTYNGAQTNVFTGTLPVFLDSGTTISRLPTTVYQGIVAQFPGAILDPAGSGLYIVPCTAPNSDTSVDFTFNTKTIRVAYSDFVVQAGANICVLGVLPETSGEAVLGDTFLRAAYVVFDQDNRNALIAQGASCGQQIISVSAGVNAVPSSTGICAPTTSTTTLSSSTTRVSTSSNTIVSTATVSTATTLTQTAVQTTASTTTRTTVSTSLSISGNSTFTSLVTGTVTSVSSGIQTTIVTSVSSGSTVVPTTIVSVSTISSVSVSTSAVLSVGTPSSSSFFSFTPSTGTLPSSATPTPSSVVGPHTGHPTHSHLSLCQWFKYLDIAFDDINLPERAQPYLGVLSVDRGR
ncbi:hypothetical protein JX265_007149 [Neoarthrinium moseri]|uniref:Peptidase A1 domain-containing protein n=1 Tax=Neoarthrinium moseri TaxID=1658444 RepID=A0A9P9WKJ4_9PEZI|nr:hypothetical protein JX266_012014 [Neoarthrinium moseri]KAI1868326.1 hypothetical protein JX265_007149 [Neoarthrinium moseri]